MINKIFGWFLVIFGFLCFLFVGGGNIRYRNKSLRLHTSLTEDLIHLAFLIAIPVIGFFSIKFGFRPLKK